jgi:acetyl-CoA C-acetyltransferase
LREAVIVSTARTPIGKAFRGAFNDTEAPALAAHAVREAVRRARVEDDEIEDVVLGCATQQGAQGYNIARLAAVAAGLPGIGRRHDHRPQVRVRAHGDRHGSQAGHRRRHARRCRRRRRVISLTRTSTLNTFARSRSRCWPFATVVHGDDRDRRGRRSSVRRSIARLRTSTPCRASSASRPAYEAGPLRCRARPLPSRKAVTDKASGETTFHEPCCSATKATAPTRRSRGLAKLEPVWSGGKVVEQGAFITAGNASQLSMARRRR